MGMQDRDFQQTRALAPAFPVPPAPGCPVRVAPDAGLVSRVRGLELVAKIPVLVGDGEGVLRDHAVRKRIDLGYATVLDIIDEPAGTGRRGVGGEDVTAGRPVQHPAGRRIAGPVQEVLRGGEVQVGLVHRHDREPGPVRHDRDAVQADIGCRDQHRGLVGRPGVSLWIETPFGRLDRGRIHRGDFIRALLLVDLDDIRLEAGTTMAAMTPGLFDLEHVAPLRVFDHAHSQIRNINGTGWVECEGPFGGLG